MSSAAVAPATTGVDAADASSSDAALAPLEIAVVGSGIAGLSIAWLLTQRELRAAGSRGLRVRLYERAAGLGMDAEALDTEVGYVDSAGVARKQLVRLDMPLRVFTEAYYRHLTGLYNHTGVQFQPEDYSASFSEAVAAEGEGSSSSSSSPAFFFGYRNWLVGSLSIPLLFLPMWRSFFNATSWRILRDLIRFHWHAKRSINTWAKEEALELAQQQASKKPSGAAKSYTAPCAPAKSLSLTLGEWLAPLGFSEDFLSKMLLPTFAGILTCSHRSVLGIPAPIALAYWCKRSCKGVRRVCQGTKSVVDKLTQHVEVHLATTVKSVQCLPVDSAGTGGSGGAQRLRVTTESRGVSSSAEFDHVILACQANHAVAMLGHNHPDPHVVQALRGVLYERSRLVTHSDTRLMPNHRDTWNSVNFILPNASSSTTSASSSPSSAASTSPASSPRDSPSPSPSGSPTSARSSSPSSWSCPSSMSSEGMATIWLNRAQSSLGALGASCTPLFQTWNPLPHLLPRKDLTLHDALFERPVVTPASIQCISTLRAKQGQNNLWFVGSYVETGMPLLETAVTSAAFVAQAMGCTPPWINSQAAEEQRAKIEAQQRSNNRKQFMAILAILAVIFAIVMRS